MTKIYIGNLNFNTTEDTLRQKFETFGKVESVCIIVDKSTQLSKGFGFVEMQDDECSNNAVGSLNGTNIDGRKVRVNIARDFKNRQSN